MRNRNCRLIACTCLLGALTGDLLADVPSYSSGRWRIEVTGYGERDPESGERPVYLTLGDRRRESSHVISVRGRFKTVTRLQVTSTDLLLVCGELKYGGDILVLVDLETGDALTTVWAYGYSMAPDTRKLIYRSHYPRLGAVEARKSVVILLPLSRKSLSTLLAEDFRPHTPGVVVFVEADAQGQPRPVQLSFDRVITSPFLWKQDSSGIVFLEYHQNVNHLVELNLDRNDRLEQTDIRALDHTDYLKGGNTMIVVNELIWTHQSTIAGTPSYPAHWTTQRFECLLPSVSR